MEVDLSKGFDQKVTLINYLSGRAVRKVPRDQKKVFQQVFSYDICKELGVKSPRILEYSDLDLLETYIEGKDFDSVTLSKEQRMELFKELGKTLQKLHSVSLNGFGNIVPPGKGEFNSWKEFIMDWFEEACNDLAGKIDAEFFDQLKDYFTSNFDKFDCKSGVFLHGDLYDDNIMIGNDGLLAGLIDFGDARVGPAEFDFEFLYYLHGGSEEFSELLKQNPDVDLEKIKFYAFFGQFWKLGFLFEKNPSSRHISLMQVFLKSYL